ncbi:hypothetical protein Tco_1116850 [Tanacetum coccineum]
MTESPLVDSNFVVPVFSLGDDRIACLNNAMAFLTDGRQAQSYFVTGYKSNATSYGGIMQADKQGLLNATTVKTKDLDTYDSECDDLWNAQAILIANISNYSFNDFEQITAVDFSDNEIHSDSNIIPHFQYLEETQQANEKANKEQNNESVTAEQKRYKERVKTFEQRLNIDLSSYQDPFHLKKAQRIKPTWYDGIVMSDKHVAMPVIDDEETLILEEKSRLKMSEKANDPEIINKNIFHKPIDYDKLNRLSEDFGKRFTPQQEMDVEQAFNPTSKPFDVSLFDNVVKIRTTLDAHTEGEWGFLVDKQCLKIAKKELLLENDRLLQQIMSQEVLLTVINSMSLIGDTVNMDGKRKESCNLEAELLKSQNAFNAQLQDKDSTICKLKDIIKSMREKTKEENVKSDYYEIETKNVELENSVATLLSENERLCNEINHVKQRDLEPLAPRLLQNTEAHIDYLKYTQEQDDILWEIVEQAKVEHPLDRELDFACKHAQRIQELLVYVQDTCPNAINLSAKKCSTSKCGSKLIGNKRNDRIPQTPSRNMKNKVEAQPRKVNKKNHVVEPLCDDNVKHS